MQRDNFRFGLGLMAAVVGMALVGCRRGDSQGNYVPTPVSEPPKAAVEPGKEADLMPLQKGNQWTYAVDVQTQANGRNQGTEVELTWKVVSTQPAGDGVRAVIESQARGGKPQRETWMVNKKGIYQVTAGGNTAFSTPQPVLIFPAEAGKTFVYQGTGVTPAGPVGKIYSKSTVLSQQQVDTENGTYWAVPVESKTNFAIKQTKGESVGTVWMAPKVGLVRFVQESTVGAARISYTLRLKSHSLSKS